MADPRETVLVLDFGSQYAQLIARRVRELKVFSKIVPCTISAEEIRRETPKGIVLSGGPDSVWADSAPRPDPGIFQVPRLPQKKAFLSGFSDGGEGQKVKGVVTTLLGMRPFSLDDRWMM